ncbi:MAG: DUF3015 family protein [SAR324 cluster bacterium]|nr:DUF3015 family protein [SAR324 cluster bacterium]
MLTDSQKFFHKMARIVRIKFWFISLTLMFIASHKLHATHYGGAPSYKKWNKMESGKSSIFVTTENSSSSTSSSSAGDSYDPYALFLQNNYHLIQEEVAQGFGTSIEVIAQFYGCQKPLYNDARHTLNASYALLFNEKQGEKNIQQKIEQVLLENELLRNECKNLPMNAT